MSTQPGLLLAAILLLSSSTLAQEPAPHSYVPKKGFVPDARTAISIAEAVWAPIYGAAQIKQERPLQAVLKGDVWVVTGSLPAGYARGGVALAEIAKGDARILRVSHEK